jgi:hypothetical protein
VPAVGSRQRLTAVSSGTAADGPLPRATFVECLTLGKLFFAECRPVPSVQPSVKRLFAESLTLPSAALGKAFFAECPTKGTRQRIQHSAKPRIPVVNTQPAGWCKVDATLIITGKFYSFNSSCCLAWLVLINTASFYG